MPKPPAACSDVTVRHASADRQGHVSSDVDRPAMRSTHEGETTTRSHDRRDAKRDRVPHALWSAQVTFAGRFRVIRRLG